ncbi:hypothetical protein TKK_0016611 [Trichogramma kaykai]
MCLPARNAASYHHSWRHFTGPSACQADSPGQSRPGWWGESTLARTDRWLGLTARPRGGVLYKTLLILSFGLLCAAGKPEGSYRKGEGAQDETSGTGW